MSDLVEWSAAQAASFVDAPTEESDKYSRGVVGIRTGSPRYPGAAVLGVEAAWRTGTGMVRYVGPPEAGAAVLARRPETVLGEGRVQAWVVGSGTDASQRSDDETDALRALLSGDVPVIADAGSLDLLQHVRGAASGVIATPHAAELARLRVTDADPAGDDADRIRAARDAARVLGCTVVLKGFRTIVASPGGFACVVAAGTAWLATAGTGDVLAGIMGAIVAGRSTAGLPEEEDLAALAATAVWIHGRAGAAASHADNGPGHPITALDVATAIPGVVEGLLRLG